MEIIRKQISIDRGISHTNGLVPYYPYNNSYSTMKFVDGGDIDGNYNQYVCDFAKVRGCLCGVTESLSYYKEQTCVSGLTEEDDSIEARFRYCDAMHNYLKISEGLRLGIYGIIVKHTESAVTSVDCSVSDHDCDEQAAVDYETTDYYDVVTISSGITSKYSFKPLDADFFTQIKENCYRFNYTDINETEDLDEKIEETLNSLVEGNAVVLINDYDKLIRYENDWQNWWEKWFGQNWQEVIYGNGFSQSPEEPYFPFCKNFEKFLLGKHYVPKVYNNMPITGVYVPEYVYNADLGDYIKWFEDRNINRDNALQNEWEKHGGDNFFAFLQSITPIWITGNTGYDYNTGGEQTMFKYITPYVSIPIVLTETYDNIWDYESYVESSQPFSATGIFSAYSSLENSHFVFFTDSGYVESKLSYVSNKNATTVNDIFGVWKKTMTSGDTPSLLTGIYHTGTSVSPGVSVIKKLYNIDGSYTVVSLSDTPEESPTVGGTTTRLLLVSKQIENVTETSDVSETGPDITDKIIKIETITATTEYSYEWWEFEPTTEDVECGDGEIINPGDAKYQSVTTISNVKRLIQSPENGDLYYFYTQYDNGVVCNTGGATRVDFIDYSTVFELPYKSDTYFDMGYLVTDDIGDLYVGNYIPPSGVSIDSGICTIDYVIGGRAYYDNENDTFTPIDETGIHYRESYNYIIGKSLIRLDGDNDIDFYYETLDYANNEELVKHEDYRLERKARKALLVGMEVGMTWTSGNAITAPIFTDEFTSIQQYDSKNILDITIDRGMASAFETNFKLNECNTLEDLENYSNNFFNI